MGKVHTCAEHDGNGLARMENFSQRTLFTQMKVANLTSQFSTRQSRDDSNNNF